MVASRLVALIGELEERGLAERRENGEGRRRYALCLTAKAGPRSRRSAASPGNTSGPG